MQAGRRQAAGRMRDEEMTRATRRMIFRMLDAARCSGAMRILCIWIWAAGQKDCWWTARLKSICELAAGTATVPGSQSHGNMVLYSHRKSSRLKNGGRTHFFLYKWLIEDNINEEHTFFLI